MYETTLYTILSHGKRIRKSIKYRRYLQVAVMPLYLEEILEPNGPERQACHAGWTVPVCVIQNRCFNKGELMTERWSTAYKPLLDYLFEPHWVTLLTSCSLWVSVLGCLALLHLLVSPVTLFLCYRDEKIAIMREKHSALMRPVVFALDHACSITAAPAETPHENWFQQTYGDAIVSALERLRNPTNPASPASSWLPFKQVCVWVLLCIWIIHSFTGIHFHVCNLMNNYRCILSVHY